MFARSVGLSPLEQLDTLLAITGTATGPPPDVGAHFARAPPKAALRRLKRCHCVDAPIAWRRVGYRAARHGLAGTLGATFHYRYTTRWAPACVPSHVQRSPPSSPS